MRAAQHCSAERFGGIIYIPFINKTLLEGISILAFLPIICKISAKS